MSDVLNVLGWYVIVTIFGLLAWPLAYRMLPGLPDRGYTISRVLGLLLVGYVFWLLCSLGLLENTTGGMLFAMLIVGGVGLWAYLTRPDRGEGLRTWLTAHTGLVIVAEVLFLLAFVGWAIVRAYNPALDHTEKPMELAFLNGVRGSQVFPPRDPWLSGYAISYYYFGYVIMAMLADLVGTASSVAFNIGIALLFALTLVGSYGLVYNLVAKTSQHQGSVLSSLLGPLLVGIMGNLEGFLELIRSLNLSFIGPAFWRWLDIEQLSEPVSSMLWPPDQWRFWWWWRASRVIQDRDITGTAIGLQPIDEFPFFSFLLGDMHPHVLALPFVLLALGLAFNALAQRERLSRPQLALYIICFGGLGFLNISDMPIYLFILVGALVVRRIQETGSLALPDLGEPLVSGLVVLALGIITYLPWYISYRSQVSGILPNAIFPTRLHQFTVMFGPFLVIILWFLADRAARQRGGLAWGKGILLGGGLLAILVVVMVGLGAIAVQVNSDARNFLLVSAGITAPAGSDAALWDAARAVAEHRLTHPLTALLLTGIIVVALACLLPRQARSEQDEVTSADARFDVSTGFVLLLALTGAMLTLGPEFVFIRDVFGQRLNTVFKFYFAAWLLWGVAAAYAAHILIAQRQAITRYAFAGTLVVVVLAGMVYPSFATPTKSGDFVRTPGQPGPTLDGIDFIRQRYPSDYNGILWLQQNAEPGAVVLEAVGGSYTYFARVSTGTGLPTVLGWPGHESQWRGSLFGQLAGGREDAVREIYNTISIGRARELLAQYHVTYVFVGWLERDPSYASSSGIQKFDRFLTAVYRDGDVVIYRTDEPLTQEQP